jgi:hypothetical protein
MSITRRHCTPDEVTSIMIRLRREGVADGAIADTLGVSRVQWNQMLNGHQPMRLVYKFAVVGYMVGLRVNKRSLP